MKTLQWAWLYGIGPKILKQLPFFQFRLNTDYADSKFVFIWTEWNWSDLDVNKEKAGFRRQHSGKEDVVKPGSVIASRLEQ